MLSVNGVRYDAMTFTTPAFFNAWLIIRTAATVITAAWPNPVNAYSDGTTPATTPMTRQKIATMSWRYLPHAKNISVTNSIAVMVICGVVMNTVRLNGTGR